MSRIKAHNPTKVVTGGDSSRSLPIGGGGTGAQLFIGNAPNPPAQGMLWMPHNAGAMMVYDETNPDQFERGWKETTGEVHTERSEENIPMMQALAWPTASNRWRRLTWHLTGVMMSRIGNTTPILNFNFKTGKPHKLSEKLVRGVWRGHSHTSWDYGSAAHVKAYEIRTDSSLSLGWFDGSNRDIGIYEPWLINIDVYYVGAMTCIASEWMGIRTTDDHMTSFKGLYTFGFDFNDILSLQVSFSGSHYSYHDQAVFR